MKTRISRGKGGLAAVSSDAAAVRTEDALIKDCCRIRHLITKTEDADVLRRVVLLQENRRAPQEEGKQHAASRFCLP
jgi:hypothetical protein